jgi:hypothetical protein
VPQVRQSVPGPKIICFDCFQPDGSAVPNRFSLTDSLKRSWASPVLFGPGTLWRTWGTRPVLKGLCCQIGEARGEMLYTFIAESNLDERVINMRQFVTVTGTPDYERSGLVAFFEPDMDVRRRVSII